MHDDRQNFKIEGPLKHPAFPNRRKNGGEEEVRNEQKKKPFPKPTPGP
jgi:hypothetical protein